MRGRHTLAAICGVLCLLLALTSGCGGSPEPKPPPKAEPSTSPSPSATPPVMPAAAKATTRSGARAFVRHYVDVLNYATFTGDTSAAHALDAGKCESCNRMLASIQTIYDGGGHVEGGAWTPTPVSDVRHPGGKGWTVDAKVTYGPQQVFQTADATPKKYTGGGRLVSFILAPHGEGWKVTEWTRSS